jgi:hypothetical protein
MTVVALRGTHRHGGRWLLPLRTAHLRPPRPLPPSLLAAYKMPPSLLCTDEAAM